MVCDFMHFTFTLNSAWHVLKNSSVSLFQLVSSAPDVFSNLREDPDICKRLNIQGKLHA